MGVETCSIIRKKATPAAAKRRGRTRKKGRIPDLFSGGNSKRVGGVIKSYKIARPITMKISLWPRKQGELRSINLERKQKKSQRKEGFTPKEAPFAAEVRKQTRRRENREAEDDQQREKKGLNLWALTVLEKYATRNQLTISWGEEESVEEREGKRMAKKVTGI